MTQSPTFTRDSAFHPVIELVRNGETGYLVPDGDWAQLAHRLKELLADQGRYESMREVAREIADTHDITVQSSSSPRQALYPA
jgi:glycosyltransferase involved in cell wall biosynthesis